MKKFEQMKRQYASLRGYLDETDLSDKNMGARRMYRYSHAGKNIRKQSLDIFPKPVYDNKRFHTDTGIEKEEYIMTLSRESRPLAVKRL